MTRFYSYPLAALGALALLVAASNRSTNSAPLVEGPAHSPSAGAPGLWAIYAQSLKNDKYADLTHTLTSSTPVWKGFGPSQFGPAVKPETGAPYT